MGTRGRRGGTERARRDNWLLRCFIEKSHAKPPSGLIISQLKFLCTLRRHREGEGIALQPALDLCCNPQVFYGFLQYFALWFLQCCFVTPLGPPRGSRWNPVATTNSRRVGIKQKRVRTLVFFVRFITKESSTHTFSLNLNFSRTEALLLIKCLLWCVLYRTPAISGSVAILKSFFCWAHTPQFLSALLDYLLLSFHPCITGAERLFDYYVENKQRKQRMFCQDFC